MSLPDRWPLFRYNLLSLQEFGCRRNTCFNRLQHTREDSFVPFLSVLSFVWYGGGGGGGWGSFSGDKSTPKGVN